MQFMNLIVISCSLNSESKSSALAQFVYRELKDSEYNVDHIVLMGLNLPTCDGSSCYSNEKVVIVSEKIKKAAGILIATPIYNYDVSAATKNLVELTGKAWNEKIVGFMCAAGGYGSYMSVMPFANSLMLDYRCTIIPRFVYTTSEDFNDNNIQNQKINKRLQELSNDFLHYSKIFGIKKDSR